MINGTFDPTRYKWKEVTGDGTTPYLVHHHYTILGHDLEAGTLDMVVRWSGDGGHCPIHRHTATTTVIVLEGEQHLWDVEEDGSLGNYRMRRAGDYALTSDEAKPHLERGGDEGGLVFFGSHSPTGRVYDVVGPDGSVHEVTIQSLLENFEADT